MPQIQKNSNFADVAFEDHGTVVLIRPLSPAAEKWLNDNVQCEPWQKMGNAIAGEPRMVHDVMSGMEADGLHVSIC